MASGRASSIWRDGALANRDDVTIYTMRHAAHRGARAIAGIRRVETPVVPATFHRTTGGLAHSRQHALVACLVNPVPVSGSRPSVLGGSSRLCSWRAP